MEMDSEDLLSGDQESGGEGGDHDLAGVDVDQLLGEEDQTMEEEGEEALVENETETEQVKIVENGDEHDQETGGDEGMEDEHADEPQEQHVCNSLGIIYFTVLYRMSPFTLL